MTAVTRWSLVIIVAVVLYMGAEWLADMAGWAESMGRTLGIGAGVGLTVGALAAALGLVGDNRG
ncbi:MAG: hypothetical protein AAFP28_12550 [Pseudomonadota bacterium]